MLSLKFIWAKAMRRLIPSSLRDCKIHRTSTVLSGGALTRVSMGKYSYCGNGCTISDTQIGAFCSIADAVSIGRAEHPMSFVSMSPVFHEGRNVMKKSFSRHRLPTAPRTNIGNDVWIGQGALIKAGISIGNGAVIGMGSVVTRNVPAYAIVAGNPARFIRARFGEVEQEALEQTRWWDWDDQEIANRSEQFHDVAEFLAEERN